MGNAQENSPRHTRTAIGLLTLSLWPQAKRDYPFLSKGVQRCPHDLSSTAQHPRAVAAQRASNSPAASTLLNLMCAPCLFYTFKLERKEMHVCRSRFSRFSCLDPIASSLYCLHVCTTILCQC